jgi:hypothetical protein
MKKTFHEKVVELADRIAIETDPERQRVLMTELRKLLEQERLRLFPPSQKP